MEKELNYKLTGENTELVKGESSQKAIENQSPKGSVVNTVTVKEVKEVAEKAKYVFDSPKRYHTNNIKALPGELLEKLECGDVVVKHTVEESKDLYHTYFVTHKQATGICLSYFAAGYSETQSYDKVGGKWVYNSQDVGE